ncbi:TetR/AcrR family transcriptional regulator [Marinobacter sp. chi1]|uniref:TetR/AcrR family transcriptional regulator n=1 Tax=Marinobacter suaedae TaxID=3057675 RepID=A0ABT8VXQ3_9GAMM|nr:TetR/AcrR family transcriptional regulator [Marinobacter sp. chi1]MDO3720713.1 TetR/AcrR family transcriptional regulator [Marinobacter sp. chi1]
MTTRSNSSHDRILEVAQSVILQKGFAGTSIDDILEKAAVTKGGFFYHFSGKSDLAKALVNNYLDGDKAIFKNLFTQADALSEDPLHQLLIFLKLFADLMSDLAEAHPGCLVAGFTYESQQFDDEVRNLIKSGVLSWRKMIAERLEAAKEKYPAVCEIDTETLADMFTTTIEGGIILSRIFQDKTILVKQVLAYRTHLRLVFGDLG